MFYPHSSDITINFVQTETFTFSSPLLRAINQRTLEDMNYQSINRYPSPNTLLTTLI